MTGGPAGRGSPGINHPGPMDIAQVGGPSPREMLADIRQMLRDPLAYLARSARRYGPVTAFPLPRNPVLLVNDPDGVRHVLVEQHQRYSKRTVQYDTLAVLTGQGLLVSDPPRWREHRRVVQPAFHRGGLPDVLARTGQASERAAASIDRLADGALVDVDALMMRATLEVVGDVLFSTDLSGAAARLDAAVLAALEQVVIRARSPWKLPLLVPTPGNRRLRRGLAELDRSVAGMLLDRRAGLATDGAAPGDVIDLLLAGQHGSPLRDDEVRDEIVTLLIAGHETVASSLTWTFHLLGRHPEVADRLAAEVEQVVGARPVIDWPDLAGLRCTRAVVDEALRLYPPAWLITRRAVEDDEVAGVRVPAGSLLLLCPYLLHRDPELWPDPERFDPGRFDQHRLDWDSPDRPRPGQPTGTPADRPATPTPTPSPTQMPSRERLAYVPFGAGPRLCIGRDFALVESVVLLASLARRFRFLPVPGREVAVDALVTLRPRGGLPMTLYRR